MRLTLMTLSLAALIGAQDSRSESRAASRPAAESRPGSLKDLAEVGQDILDVFGGRPRRSAAHRLAMEGFEQKKAGRLDEALATFERVGTEFADTHRTVAWLMIVMIHESRGDVDSAIEVVEHEMRRTDGEQPTPEFIHGQLASLLERKKDWQGAREEWELSPPSEWGHQYGSGFSQEHGLARCEFHLGQVESALRRLESCLSKASKAEAENSEYDGTLNRMEAWRIAFSYVEFSGRSGRIAEARSFASKLPAALRADCLVVIGIVERWLAKDAEGMLRAVAGLHPFQIAGAGRLMGELGEPGVAALARGIEAGDPVAIRLSAWSARPELLPALRRLGPEHETAQEAAAEIAYATTRPASRPASRRSK